MAIISPTEGADKLKRAIQQRGNDYLAGVNRVTENPAQKAIENKEKWFAAITDAHNNDRYAKGLAPVTLSGWKQSVADGGQARYTQSADKAAKNYKKFADEFYPFLEQVQSQVRSMPKRNLAESIARMVANVELISDFKNR